MPPNRLARESSPYLRQHQHNPVDWYPWGPEALDRARAEDRPILLSVGYSACHWCHVMERESFEDPATAARMNALFVNIKVDREERPDIDNIYQTAVQILRRSGGWPLTVFLTPDGRPFFAGTYFPPEPRYGMPGFPDLLDQVDRAWREKRSDVERSADAITQGLARVRETGAEDEPGDAEVTATAATFLLSKVDELHGGFGTAPKFPSPTNLWTLWRHWRRGGPAAEDARDAVLLTLVRMADGGIHDQLAGGFHRYSTDEEWLVPHFEKMLYDNAQLACLYFEAWRECAHGAGPRERAVGLLRVATDILTYLQRDMQSPDGLYYAATDADSEGVEGRYFVWTPAAVGAALAGEPDGIVLASAFCRTYDVTAAGNWEGHAIPRRLRPWGEVARELGIDVPTLEARLARARPILLAARALRVPPLRDEKVLVSWNALTILAFIDGWRATGRTDWKAAAVRAADALLARLFVGGRLQHSLCDDDVRGPGFLDDHAAFGLALLHVAETTGNPRYRTAAVTLADALDAHFHDGAGGWFQTPDDGEALVLRPRDTHDSAVPSGTGLTASFLWRLYAHTQDERWRERTEGTLRANAGLLRANPYGAGVLLGVLDGWLGGFEEVVLGGSGPERDAMAAVAGEVPGLDRIVLDLDTLPAGHPARAGRTADRPVAWVCRGQTCTLPIEGAASLRDRLTAR